MVTSDPYDAVPGLRLVRDAGRAGDWPRLDQLLRSVPDAEDLAYALGCVAEVDWIERCLEEQVASRPDDALARVALAYRYVIVGWKIRSALTAEHVTQEQFDRFHSWLRQAEQILIQVCAEHPEFTAAWHVRLMTARGLELGASESRRRMDRLARHHAHHYPAQTQMLQQLCPKWGGSWDDVHGFVSEALAAAPLASHTGALVPDSHIERWLDLGRGEAGAEHLRRPEVRDAIVDAARRSVLHPDYSPRLPGIGAHSLFALALSLGGHHAHAAPHYRFLGERYSGSSWEYLPDPDERFEAFRRAALAA